jgi:hypothetical protein
MPLPDGHLEQVYATTREATVAGWTRRLAANAGAIRLDAVRRVVALNQDMLSTAVHQRPAAAALDALKTISDAAIVTDRGA